VILFFISYQVASWILMFPIALILVLRHHSMATTFGLLGPFFGCLAGLAVSAVAISLEIRPFRSLGFSLGVRWFREAFLGVILGAIIIILVAFLLRGLGAFHWMPEPGRNLKSVFIGFSFFLAVAVNEETLFRGYSFQSLVGGIGAWPSMIIFAIIFALIHLGNPGISFAVTSLKWVTLLNIALAGILQGLCYLRSGSLALPIGVHLGWNWAQGSLLGFGVSGTNISKGFWTPIMHQQPLWLSGGDVGLEGSIVCTMVCGLGILMLALWKARE
jgi:membrane protease YdiL (CAAX protease family)